MSTSLPWTHFGDFIQFQIYGRALLTMDAGTPALTNCDQTFLDMSGVPWLALHNRGYVSHFASNPTGPHPLDAPNPEQICQCKPWQARHTIPRGHHRVPAVSYFFPLQEEDGSWHILWLMAYTDVINPPIQ